MRLGVSRGRFVHAGLVMHGHVSRIVAVSNRLTAAGWTSAGLVLALILAVVISLVGYSVAYQDRVQPGVQALGINLGGLREPEAQARLTEHIELLTQTRPALRVDGQEIVLPASAFAEPAVLAGHLSRTAVFVGRETPLAPFVAAARVARARPAVVSPPAVETPALRQALAAVAHEVDQPVIEAQLLVGGADFSTVQVIPGRAGKRLDVDRTAADLAAAFMSGGTLQGRRVVEATVLPLAPSVDEVGLAEARRRMAAVLSQPLEVVVAERAWTVDRPGRLIERIEVRTAGAGVAPHLDVTLDEAAFMTWAAPVVTASARPAQDARLEIRGEEVVLVPAVAGAGIGIKELRQALAGALVGDVRRVLIAPGPVPARITTEMMAPVHAEVTRIIGEPLVVTRGERRWTLSRPDLAKMVALPNEPEPVRLDESKLAATLSAMAKESDRPAKNPRLEVQDGQIVAVPGEDGEALDIPATVAAMQAALRPGQSSTPASPARIVAAVTQPVAPELAEAKLTAAKAQAEKITGGPLTARYGARTWTVAREELPGMLLFSESVNGIVPYLSRNKVMERLQPFADELNVQLERDYRAALNAWEQREREREREREAQQAREEEAQRVRDASQATEAQASDSVVPTPASRPVEDPKPKRQWMDVGATAAALWVQATGERRVVDVKLTTDSPVQPAAPAQAPTQAQSASQVALGKWIDVNLTTQTLVAYEGDWPVFNALVSTGLPRTPTPVGTYRVFTKLVKDDMRGGSVAAGDYYYLPGVPYVMYFLEGGYAIHGTYWHSNFGNPMSRGCVNLTPEQAKWLYEWAPMGTTVVVHQ